MNIQIKSNYQVAAHSIFTMLVAAVLLVLPSGCTNNSELTDGVEQTTLTPLSSIDLKTSVSIGAATTTKTVTTRATNLYYNYYMVEASFEGHDGSTADKPISVGYYRTIDGMDLTTLEDLSVGKGTITDLNLIPISADYLAMVGITAVGTQADGSLLVPASGEFNLRLHGFSALFNGALPANMNALLQGTEEGRVAPLYTFWTGKAKMNGTSLIATADLAAADGAAPANGAILLRYPYARVNFNVIGAYGEGTATQPYLASDEFYVSSSLVKYLDPKWCSTPQTAGTSAFQSPWFLKEFVDNISWTNTENRAVYGLFVSQANKESIAANGASFKEGQTLFTFRGQQTDAYSGKTYDIVVPTGGITFWAGHIYTYTIRLTESKAVIESVTVGGFTNEGDYNIDLNGNVTGGNKM
jgi:hypothetical protein